MSRSYSSPYKVSDKVRSVKDSKKLDRKESKNLIREALFNSSEEEDENSFSLKGNPNGTAEDYFRS